MVHFLAMFPSKAACSSSFVSVDNLDRNVSISYNVSLLFDDLVISDPSKKSAMVSATSPIIIFIFV